MPVSAFAHDLPYGEAVELLHRLRAVAERRGLEFGAKVSGTLPVENHQRVFDAHRTVGGAHDGFQHHCVGGVAPFDLVRRSRS